MTAPDTPEAVAPPCLFEVEVVAWAILRALHVNVPESERPQSWSDMKGDQEARIRAAATAAIQELDYIRHDAFWSDGKAHCLTCGDELPKEHKLP